MGDASGAHVEATGVIWVGIQAVGFAVAESRSWGMGGGGGSGGWSGGASTRLGGGGGSGGWSGGASTRLGGGGGRQWRQLWKTKQFKRIAVVNDLFWMEMSQRLTSVQEGAEVTKERVVAISTELPCEVVQIQSPNEGTSELVVVHIANL